jgi:O-antigen/teichoic acid export membrane protein
LVKPFWVLGIDRVVQNSVGSADYGIYFSLFNLSILFNIILDLGLTNFNNRNIARHSHLLSKYFSNIVVLKILLGVLYAIITITVGLIAGYDYNKFKLLIILIFNQFLLSFILYLRSNISGLHKFKTDSIISVLDRIIMIIIIGTLLWGKLVHTKFKIEWFVLAQTVAYIITATVAFFIVLKKAKFIKLRINKAFLFSTIRHTAPFALLVLFMSFYNRFDAVLLERLLPNGDTQAGIYAQSFRLLDALSQFSLLFANLLLPIFSRMIKKKENVTELVEFSFFLLLIPATIITVASIFYSSDIISLLYKENALYSAKVFAILIIAFIPISVTYIFGTLLTANGNLRQLNIVAFSGVILNLILNLFLIPRLKAQGAAISAVTTQTYTAIAQMIIAMITFKIKFKAKKLFTLIFFSLIFISIIIFLHKTNLEWYISYIIAIIAGIILALVLKLLNLRLMLNILKGYED